MNHNYHVVFVYKFDSVLQVAGESFDGSFSISLVC